MIQPIRRVHADEVIAHFDGLAKMRDAA